MTITNYIPTSDNHLFQNNEYIIYFEYNNIIYVFRNTNRIINDNNRPENLRHENLRHENLRHENLRTNNYNNSNYNYIRNDYIRNY